MSIDPLTQGVLNYQIGIGNYQELFNRISLMIYRFPQKFFAWSEDEASEFYLSEIPSLDGILQRFRYNGRPFKHYLANTLKWKVLHFLRRRERQNWGIEVAEGELIYLQSQEIENPEGTQSIENQIPQEFQKLLEKGRGKLPLPQQKRLIYLLLKCAWYISDYHVTQAVEKTHYTEEFLQGCLAQLRDNLLESQVRLKRIQDRRAAHFSKVLYYQNQKTKDPSRLEKWSVLEAHHRQRIKALTREASVVNFMPSHGEIAKVLGTPKGTVDSGLYYFRNLLNRVSKSGKKTYTRTHGNSHCFEQSS